MAKIINLRPPKLEQHSDDNLITSKPWEFRKAHWNTPYFVQMLRVQSAKFETQRHENQNRDSTPTESIPSHYSLKGGIASTIKAICFHREDEARMREIYYLAGLIDCMINQVNPVLRTDILRAMYKEVFAIKQKLNVRWHPPLDKVLLPIDSELYDVSMYRFTLNKANTMKGIYQAIKKGTDEMFDILSIEYIFYCPSVGGLP